MKRTLLALSAIALIASPAFAQVMQEANPHAGGNPGFDRPNPAAPADPAAAPEEHKGEHHKGMHHKKHHAKKHMKKHHDKGMDKAAPAPAQ